MDKIADHDAVFGLSGEGNQQDAIHGSNDDQQEPEEQRLHMRAYTRWVEAPRIGEFPTWQSAMLHGRAEFGPQTIILNVLPDSDDPEIIAIGDELRKEVDPNIRLNTVGDVPRRSLISRITDNYFQVIANRAPVGFEAEFIDAKGLAFVYRAILLPCSTNGQSVDNIIGVMSWKRHETYVVAPMERAKHPPHITSPTVSEEEGVNIMPKGAKKMTYESKMQECMEIEGALGVALVDLASGMALSTAGNPRGMSLEVAAAGNTNVVRAKLAVMKDLEIKDKLEDILITLSTQYHLIRVVNSDTGTGVFIYLVLDKTRANLAMARFKLSKIESELTI